LTSSKSNCGQCGSDKVKPEDFADELSRKEYSISLMCQRCQDVFFADVEDDGTEEMACPHCGSFSCYEVSDDDKLRCAFTGKEVDE